MFNSNPLSHRNSSKTSTKSAQDRPWIANEEVRGLPSAFGVNQSDIIGAITEGLEKIVLSPGEQKPFPVYISRDVLQSKYVRGLSGRSDLGINGAGFSTGGLVRISWNDKGWSWSYEATKEDVGVGTMIIMPNTGAIRCCKKPFPTASGAEPQFASLNKLLGLKKFTAPPSSIKIKNFSREIVSASLVKLVKINASTLSDEQAVEVITPLLKRLEEVSSNITNSLCAKLIPFAADILKKGDALELNAYNFTTTAGIGDERVYRWAQAQYQPLITLLSRMKPESLLKLAQAISLQKGDEKITNEIANLFGCSPCLIGVLTETKPDVEQLSLIVTRGESVHITHPSEGMMCYGVREDRRSYLQRFISLYANIDDKGAENLIHFFNAAKSNTLSLEQMAFSSFCQSTEDVSENPIVNIIPRLLREIKAGEPLSYSELDRARTKADAAITDLHDNMVHPLMSKRAGFREEFISEIKGQNPRMNELIEKVFQQKRVPNGDYVQLARAMRSEWVEDLLIEWPLGLPFNKQAYILTFCLAIMGGMDRSAIDDSYLSEFGEGSATDLDEAEINYDEDPCALIPTPEDSGIDSGIRFQDDAPDLSKIGNRKVGGFFYNYGCPFKRDTGSLWSTSWLFKKKYFFKEDADDSWAQLLQGEAMGTFCNIIPSPANDRDAGEIEFLCQIIDPKSRQSIGTLELRVEKKGDSYRVIVDRVVIGTGGSKVFGGSKLVEEDGKLPSGYEFLADDIRTYVDGLNSRQIDPEFFNRLDGKVEEFKVALSEEIYRIIDRLHPEPEGGFAEAIATAHNRLSKIFPWLNDLPTMWKLTDEVNRLQDKHVYTSR